MRERYLLLLGEAGILEVLYESAKDQHRNIVQCGISRRELTDLALSTLGSKQMLMVR